MTMFVLAALTLRLGVVQDPQDTEPIPMQAGLTIVQAVSGDAYQGRDYEAVIAIGSVDTRGVALGSRAFVKDRAGERRWLTVQRTISGDDIRGARALVLGFDTDDAEHLPGTTGLGPSRLIVDELRQSGRANVSVRLHAARAPDTGTLERVEPGAIPFPVLLNGARITVPVIHARGQLGTPGSTRPWEFWFLDHPVQPLTLRAAYGAENQRALRQPGWSRQIVRIDMPEEVAGPAGSDDGVDQGSGRGDLDASTGRSARAGSNGGMGAGTGAGAGTSLERRFAATCRVPVPGIYFEFDSDVLNPASRPWIRSIAEMLRRHPEWAVTIEGHTDSIGVARYNLDLSVRRAAALTRSLASEHGIAAARLSTRGFGPNRPLESNGTVEGRARNRRVELVRPCNRPTR